MTRQSIKTITILALCVMVMQLFAGCAQQPPAEQAASHTVTQLFLYGDMSGMMDKKDVRSIAAIFVQGEKTVSSHATIKLQGTSSLNYEKKNYTIKFYDDPDHQQASAIDLGWGVANEYCLKANWIDKTHSRNVVTAKLAAEVQKKYSVLEQAPCNGLIDGFPVEVYINDAFHGIYTWNIPKAAWMFAMNENDPNHIVLSGENWDNAVLFREPPHFAAWSVEVGVENEETLQKFARLSDFIMNSSDEDFKANFHEYLNLDAVLNYCVLVDFAYLPDNLGKNMLMVTYDGQVWYPSLYDLDTSWGTDWTGWEKQDYANTLLYFGNESKLANRVETLYGQELHDRYFELRKDILTKEHVLALFTAFDSQIPQEWKTKEIQRWGEGIPGYDLSQIEEYLDSVIDRLDQKYKDYAK